MSNVFRKKAKEFTVNGEKIMVRPLGIGTIIQLKELRGPVASAIANLKSVGINDFEEVTHSSPKPTDADPDGLELIKKTSHSAPSPAMFKQVTDAKAEGIKALFDCLLQEDLLDSILRQSVDVFKDREKGSLLDAESDESLDIPTCVEILGYIVEVNIGGFESLGKSWPQLKKYLAGLGVETK